MQITRLPVIHGPLGKRITRTTMQIRLRAERTGSQKVCNTFFLDPLSSCLRLGQEGEVQRDLLGLIYLDGSDGWIDTCPTPLNGQFAAKPVWTNLGKTLHGNENKKW